VQLGEGLARVIEWQRAKIAGDVKAA